MLHRDLQLLHQLPGEIELDYDVLGLLSVAIVVDLRDGRHVFVAEKCRLRMCVAHLSQYRPSSYVLL